MGNRCFLQELELRAHRKRRSPEPAEEAFADALMRAGVAYEQQKVVAGSAAAILDFYVPKLQLAIEVDGRWHNDYGQFRDDLQRTFRIHQDIGAEMLRIPNEAAMQGSIADKVARLIAAAEKDSVRTLERRVNELLIDSRTRWALDWILKRYELLARYTRETGPSRIQPTRERHSREQRARLNREKTRDSVGLAEGQRRLPAARRRLEKKKKPRRRPKESFDQLVADAQQRVLEDHRRQSQRWTYYVGPLDYRRKPVRLRSSDSKSR